MRTLYVDSVGGLAGDMFLAAALDAGFATLEEMRDLVARWLPERVTLESEEVTRAGMRARTFRVLVGGEGHGHSHEHSHEHPHERPHEHPHEHAHEHPHDGQHGHEHHHAPPRRLEDVFRLLDVCPAAPGAVDIAKRMFVGLAGAEAKAHGSAPDQVHFHEVGATDSLVDVALAAHVLARLAARVEASPALLGRGRVRMEHGWWPVPPPGTAELLRAHAIPTRSLPPDFPWENAELTTPTGACLLSLASSFGAVPAGRVVAIGTGAGTLDIPGFPNVARLMLVESGDARVVGRFDSDRIAVLETWIDDTPGNVLALATDELVREGALDVAVSTVTLRKGRVGYRVEVLAPPERAEALAAILLARTTAIGLRVRESERWKLFRRPETTADGLPGKLSHDAEGRIARVTPETSALEERARAGGAEPLFGWKVEDRSKR